MKPRKLRLNFIKTLNLHRTLFLIGIILFLTCGEKLHGQGSDANRGLKNILFDSTRSTIITTKQAVGFAFNDTYSSTKLSRTECLEIQSLLIQAIQKYNSRWRISGDIKDFGIDTIKYKYKIQVVPALNPKGEKEVWINAFCDSFGEINWKRGLVFVTDGGNCFFNLKINLSELKAYNIVVNGYA